MNRQAPERSKLDLATLFGVLLAFGGILGGLLLEGGRIQDVSQLTGGLIVLGGTLGAVMVTTPAATLLGALRKLKYVFLQPSVSPSSTIDQILAFANRARRNGIISLESEVDAIQDPFLRKALSLAVDGTDLEDLRKIMEVEIDLHEIRGRAQAKVYDSAGGYAPTIGIIGAVLGLIQVMKHLDNIEMVGHGIAVAFVATVYGVASANIFFIPAGQKLQARLEQELRMKELALEGICSVVQGLNPKVIEHKLEAYDEARAGRETPFATSRRSVQDKAA